jgi:glucose/arabinose dehydrogenase
MTGRRAWGAAALAVALVVSQVRPAGGVLATAGFRAVAVAHSAWPISSIAVAPDGRLFAAIQANGQTIGTTPGTAEIRTYTSYATTDGSVLDRGTLWATVDGVRATTSEEGLLGVALAPDFTTSKLVYVYLTTTDESVNQHVRVYHEKADGTGEYLATVQTGLEPPTESTNRNGGGLAFGVDGCLYAGVGDNGGANRWNAQLLAGTDPMRSQENEPLCNAVCLGSSKFPARTGTTNGAANDAGKVLRLAVNGAAPAAPAPRPSIAQQPLVFGAGMRNPTALAVHPLTGQVFATDRSDTLEAEVDVVDAGSNMGWPCIEGNSTPASGVVACMVGHTPADVYAQHPSWHRPIASHTANPVVTGIAAYTGLAYPADFYGDVFYLLRDSARIYRLDLEPPCFLPHPGGMTPLAFHDTTADGDFSVNYDFDGNGTYETMSFATLMSIAQGPNPLGQQVLYVAAKQGNSAALTEDSVIYRIEYATAFTPYPGPFGPVDDACFASGPYSGGSGPAPYAYENPFQRQACQTGVGACLGQAEGAPCGGGDACRAASTCHAGVCTPGAPAADGTSCDDGDPCNGTEACAAGVCQAAVPPAKLRMRSLVVKRELRGPGSGAVTLQGAITPAGTIAPQSADAVTVELRDAAGVFFTGTVDHPASDPLWHAVGPALQYVDGSGAPGVGKITLRHQRSGAYQVTIRARPADLSAMAGAASNARLRIGGQCFAADLGARCRLDARKLRCGG